MQNQPITPALWFLGAWTLCLIAVDLYFRYVQPPTISASLAAITRNHPDLALFMWLNLGLLAWHLTGLPGRHP